MLFLVKICLPVCLVNVLCVQEVYLSGELGGKSAKFKYTYSSWEGADAKVNSTEVVLRCLQVNFWAW